MADLALVTAGKLRVVQSFVQHTGVAGEAITIGDAVRLDIATGRFTKANGTSAAEARFYGVALKTVVAGEALTALREGFVDGFDLTAMDYDEAVHLSNTDGKFGDVAATVPTIVGRVIPAHAQTLGNSPDKIIHFHPAS